MKKSTHPAPFSKKFIWLGAVCFWLVPFITDLLAIEPFRNLALKNELSFRTLFTGLYLPSLQWLFYTPITVILFPHCNLPGSKSRDWVRHIFKHLGFFVVFMTLIFVLGILVRKWFLVPWQNEHQFHFFRPSFSKAQFYYLLNLVVCHLVLIKHWQHRQSLKEAHLENEVLAAHLQSLRQQLQPHFLFNTLNTITVLIRKQANLQAIDTLQQLSDLLRNLLHRQEQSLISLGEELDFIKSYLAIEAIRFGERFQYAILVDSHLNATQIPPLILQPLVENTVKHAVTTSGQITHLEIKVIVEGSALVITIEDDGPGIDPETLQYGVGLELTTQRLARRFGRDDLFTLKPSTPKGTRATIRIPLTHEEP